MNPANRSHELSFVLRKSRMRALFLHAEGRHSNYKSILEECRAQQTLALEHVIYLDSAQWGNFLRDPDGISVEPDPDEPANIQYTSGTTGQSKGVLLTHVNLVNNARFFVECMRLTEQDRICIPVPMFHCFGCVMGAMTAAVSGAACIFPASTYDPLATLEAIDTDKATVTHWHSDDVYRRTPASGICAFSIGNASHRHHGWRSLPDRNHAAGYRYDALPPHAGCLRSDRKPRPASPARVSMTIWKSPQHRGCAQFETEVKIISSEGL